MTKAERARVYTAYAEFEAATERYLTAIAEFQKVFDPKQTGLTEFSEQINEVLADIDAELDEEI